MVCLKSYWQENNSSFSILHCYVQLLCFFHGFHCGIYSKLHFTACQSSEESDCLSEANLAVFKYESGILPVFLLTYSMGYSFIGSVSCSVHISGVGAFCVIQS